MDLEDLLKGLSGRLGGMISGGGSPFHGDVRLGSFSPFGGNLLNSKSPFQGGLQAKSPFQGKTLAADSPFRGTLQAMSPFQGGFLGARSPFGTNPLGGLTVFNPYMIGQDNSPAARAAGATGGSGTPSAGMPANVARWAEQTRKTFGDLGADMPDIMLAIMMNESGGDPNVQNRQGYPAYGLFQLWNQPGLSADQQFAAARKLAEEKLRGIHDSYALHGLNPDARTRARDFALAWAGHFNYNTGQPNPRSADVGSGQTADELAAIFLKNYDAIKGGRSAPGGSGPMQPGTLSSIWGGGNAPIMQEFGNTTYSAEHPYNYGGDFGMGSGHHGVDFDLKYGTNLYSPVAGTVIIAGGSGYFRDDMGGGDGPGRGELRIRLDNGEEVILGHMSFIGVRVGDRVNAGALVGRSGGADGAHLHLEWRVRDPSTGTGWRVVDPRTKLH